MELKNKRGEITTHQLILIIIFIMSFAIILIFSFKLSPGDITESEICRNSIVATAKSGILKGSLVNSIDCKTNYVCISAGGECTGIDATKTVLIEDPYNKDEVTKAILEEYVDCWWTYGKGMLNFNLGSAVFQENVCAVCSKISFDAKFKKIAEESLQDNDFKNDYPGISYKTLYSYASNKLKDDSLTYYDYFCHYFLKDKKLSECVQCILPMPDQDESLNRDLDFNKDYYLTYYLIDPSWLSKNLFRIKYIRAICEGGTSVEPDFYPSLQIFSTEEISNIQETCKSSITKAS